MPENHIPKLRSLLNDPTGEEVCAQDLMDACVNMSMPLAKLEVENNKTALVDAKRALRKLKRMVVEMENRVKTTVAHEIAEWHVDNDVRDLGTGRSLSND